MCPTNKRNIDFQINIMTPKPILTVSNLKTWFPIKRGIIAKTVGYVRAVDDVSFHINKGETLGLVGESGCGKTTLGRTLVGLEKAHKGEIVFQGKNILALKKNEYRNLRKNMQIIFQDPLSSLNPRMNILDIVTEGLIEFKMVTGSIKEHAIRLMNEVGLDGDAIHRYPHEFSGGQRQRINIARAVSLKPSFIVCDEPISALDVSVQAQIINLFIDLQEEYELSYLFISHDLSVVSNIADRVAVMYLGKLMECGITDDIINRPMHPYTRALISAVPVPDPDKKREHVKKIILKGETPSPAAPPPGCRFHTRCPEVMSICREKKPRKSGSERHQVWCHLF